MSVDHIGMWRRRGALVALAGGLAFPWLGAGLPPHQPSVRARCGIRRMNPPASPQARRQAPPAMLSSFVGRRAQVTELADLVAERRLVTVTGPGGSGKTRLAIEVLAATEERWSDGVGWVDLAAVTDPSRIGTAAATSLGVLVGPSADAQAALASGLADCHLVVALDNCEHVLDACSELIERLLRSCPDVSVLATSREPLGVPGETVWRVPSMTDSDVVALFVERARAVRADFDPDIADIETVRTLCRRLDGIPLAVELAAAWVRVLTPAQIAAALDDRFGLLVGGPRGAMARQQTLLASVEWSYDLLRHDARTLLRRVAVFPRDFDLAAAVAVGGDGQLPPDAVVHALGRLVDTSILVVDERGGVARYRLLETIREYAMARLVEAGELAGCRDRHLAHFLAVAEDAAQALDHGDQDLVLARLEVEHDNLRAALDWGFTSSTTSSSTTSGRRLAAALVRKWFLRGYVREGIDALQVALDLAAEDSSSLQAELLAGLALMAIPAGRVDLNEEAASRALELADRNGDDRVRARATAYAAFGPFYTDYLRAGELGLAAQRHGDAAGEVFAVDLGLLFQAVSLGNRDRHDEAARIAEELFARCMPRNDRFGAAFALSVRLYAMLLTGDVRGAVEIGVEAVRIAEPLHDYLTTGTNISNLAWATGVAGRVAEAQRMMESLVSSIDGVGPDVDVVNLRLAVGKLHLWAGELDEAVEWLGRAAPFRDLGVDSWTSVRALPSLAGALRRMGRHDEAAATAERGVAMAERLGTPHAHAESLDELAHGFAAADDLDRAERLHHEALAVRVAHGLRTHLADSLDALAHIAATREEHLDAVRLLAAATAARAGSGYPRPQVDEHAHAELDATLRGALDDATYTVANSEGTELTLDEAVAYISRSRGRRGRPSLGWSSLTPTEASVVALVVEGLSNPQIAERLFVSRATIKTHLAHIFTKVGVTSRAELAALAARRGADGHR